MKYTVSALLFFLSLAAYGQPESKSLEIIPVVNGEVLKLEKRYYIPELEDSLSFDRIKFYLSEVEFFEADKKVGSLAQKHLLVDVENPESLSIPIQGNTSTSFDKIHFQLGIDSLTSVSGVFGGDLDPMQGMYWSWQSGYINVKIEGKADKCPARKYKFQFHLGGYAYPGNCLQEIELAV
ncbi:MAG: MbnP family protein, partial [Bacteroidota bacterium]